MGSSACVLQEKQTSKRVSWGDLAKPAQRDHANQLGTNLYAKTHIIVTSNGLEFENTRHRWDTSHCQMVWGDQEKSSFQNLCNTAES